MSGRASIRSRLARWYAVAVAAAVLAYGVVLFVSVRGALYSELDGRLRDDYEAIEHQFAETPDGALRFLDEVPSHDAPDYSRWVQILAPDGTVRLQRPGAPVFADDDRVYEHVHRLGSTEYRIRVGRSTQTLEDTLARLRMLALVCALPAVGLAFLAGRFLAGRALAPVEAMTDRARSITADRLSERLPIANPDDELGRLSSVFNETFARLERAFEQLRRFTADASHELRTPLAALRAVGEVSLREPRSAEQYRDVIGSMLEEADRLARLVDALLTLSRADAGRIPVVAAPLSLLDVSREVAAHLGVLAEEKGMSIDVTGDDSARVSADRMLLRQALENVVDNAIKFGPSGSRVAIRVSSRDGESRVEVSDTGPGIAPEHRERVFDRFYRVDAARERGGTGLGLAIAKWAVEANRGRVELDSSEGGGSTFRLVFPADVQPSGR